MSNKVAIIDSDLSCEKDFIVKKKISDGRRRNKDEDEISDYEMERKYEREYEEKEKEKEGRHYSRYYYDEPENEHNHEDEKVLTLEEEMALEQDFLKQFYKVQQNEHEHILENWENEIEYNYEKEEAAYEAMSKYDDGPRDDLGDDLCDG